MEGGGGVLKCYSVSIKEKKCIKILLIQNESYELSNKTAKFVIQHAKGYGLQERGLLIRETSPCTVFDALLQFITFCTGAPIERTCGI